MRGVLYQLKREYGGRIFLYKRGASDSNPQTGERSISATRTRIDRAIILPAEVARQDIRGISLISANKQMVMGGGFDNSVRVFVIDRRDAPNVEVTKDDWIVFGNMRYDFDHVQLFEFDTAWLMLAHALVGEPAGGLTHVITAGETVEFECDANQS